MLRTAAHRLNRRPHVSIGWEEIPSCGEKAGSVHTTAFIDGLRTAVPTIVQYARPHHIAIPLDDAVGGASLERLFREQCRVDTAEDNPGAPPPSFATDPIPAQCVTGVDPDPDNISGLHL
jgi:hypothetical protein